MNFPTTPVRSRCRNKPVADHVFETVSSETVYSGKILALRTDEVRMPGGGTAVREVVEPFANVRVESFTGLVRDFAVGHGARAMLRGVRSVTDFDFENQLAGMNRALAPDVDTVFLTPDSRYQYISSTLVREIATLKGDVAQFVSPTVHARLMRKLNLQ